MTDEETIWFVCRVVEDTLADMELKDYDRAARTLRWLLEDLKHEKPEPKE